MTASRTRDQRMVRWGMPVLVLLTATLSLPMLAGGDGPPLPLTLLVLASVPYAMVGRAVLREACGMPPLAWLAFRAAGLDPAEEAERHARGRR